MGNLVEDTTVAAVGEGRFRADLDRAWEIWGPAGGYVAAITLRAAGAASVFDRPANCAVQFLGVAGFDDPVDVTVEVLKRGRRAEATRALMTQGDRPILQLTAWAVGDDVLGRRHRHGSLPHPRPHELPTVEERLRADGVDPADRAGRRHGFWDNFEERPVDWISDWDNRPVLDPVWQWWCRYLEAPVTDDPWMEAARLLLLVDLGGWPAAHRAYPQELADEWYAPSLDVACQFVDVATTEWLCVEHTSPAGGDGLLNADGRVSSEDGRLLAAGVTQLLATPTRR